MKTTTDQFYKIMDIATAHFGIKDFDGSRYYQKIQYFQPYVVSEAINSLVDSAPPLVSRFPTPVALLMACKDAASRQGSDNKPKDYGCHEPGCNNGFVSFYRILNGRRIHASNPCASCFPSHVYPQVAILDHVPVYATRRDGKKYKADFTNLKAIPDSQYLDDKQFVEYLQKGMHRIPGEYVAVVKPKPKQTFVEQSDPVMIKAQARDMLKNLLKEA